MHDADSRSPKFQPLPIEEEPTVLQRPPAKDEILYKVEDSPPFMINLLLGFQQYLISSSGALSYPFMLAPAVCMRDNDPARGALISTIFFVSGIATLIQTTFGVRLPIIQGCSVTFLVPIVAIMSLPEWKCPTEIEIIASRSTNFTGPVTESEWTHLWQSRILEISGAIIVSSLFEFLLGATGVVGFMFRFVTPLGIAPTIALMGLSLFEEAAKLCSKSWPISIMSIVLMTIFSQYITDVLVPMPIYSDGKIIIKRVAIFRMIPVLLALITSWGVCYIFTITDYFGPENNARTDTKLSIIESSPWIRIPYPGQFGAPTYTVGAIIGMLSAIISSIIESIGDYSACASLSKAPEPPKHAINRGIMFEGIGSIIAGFFGAGCGLTSYSGNISIIALTKVACRSVIHWSAIFMIIFGVVGKVGAVFATIPDPVVGAVFVTLFSLIVGVGISSTRKVDMTSSRNLYILGTSLFAGVMIAHWTRNNTDSIKTGNLILDQTLIILLSTSMFVGGVLGMFLDNTIPGTLRERGLAVDTKISVEDNGKNCYDLPYVGRHLDRLPFLPFSPTYTKTSLPNFIRSISRQSRQRSTNSSIVTPEI